MTIFTLEEFILIFIIVLANSYFWKRIDSEIPVSFWKKYFTILDTSQFFKKHKYINMYAQQVGNCSLCFTNAVYYAALLLVLIPRIRFINSINIFDFIFYLPLYVASYISIGILFACVLDPLLTLVTNALERYKNFTE